MRRLLPLIALIALALPPIPCLADDWKASGYVRSFLTGTDLGRLGLGSSAEIESRLRLKLGGDITEALRAEVAFEIAPRWREKNTLAALYASAYTGMSYRIGDIDEMLFPSDIEPHDTFYVSQNLDRAFLTHKAEGFDLHVGRQAVSFGSARIINPTDVLAPYTFSTLAKEERIGVDAVRLMVPTAELGQLDAGVVFGDDARERNSAEFARYRADVSGTGVSLMLMRYRRNEMLGLDINGSIGGASAWLEAAYTNSRDGDDYARLTAGLDYALTSSTYAFAEYHFNGTGATDRDSYSIDGSAYADGAVYLLGAHYIGAGLTHEITPLLALSAQGLLSLTDASAMLGPSLQYNMEENVYTGLGAYVGIGAQDAEFRQSADVYYASFSVYF